MSTTLPIPQVSAPASHAIVIRPVAPAGRFEVWAAGVYAGQIFELGDASSEYANPTYYVARAPRGADGFEPNDATFAKIDDAAGYLAGRVTSPYADDMDGRWAITVAGLAALFASQSPDDDPIPPVPTRAARPRMTPATLEARVRQRAHDEHVYIRAVAGRPGCYVTRSKWEPSDRYNLVAGPDGIIGCSCKGFEYWMSCKHSEALKARLAREAVQAARSARLEDVAA